MLPLLRPRCLPVPGLPGAADQPHHPERSGCGGDRERHLPPGVGARSRGRLPSDGGGRGNSISEAAGPFPGGGLGKGPAGLGRGGLGGRLGPPPPALALQAFGRFALRLGVPGAPPARFLKRRRHPTVLHTADDLAQPCGSDWEDRQPDPGPGQLTSAVHLCRATHGLRPLDKPTCSPFSASTSQKEDVPGGSGWQNSRWGGVCLLDPECFPPGR